MRARLRAVGPGLVLVAVFYAYVIAILVWHVSRRLTGPAALTEKAYTIPGYFVSYDQGFVRRGLPGSVLDLFSRPTLHAASVMFWILTGVALASVLGMVAAFIAKAPAGLRRWLVGFVLLASPFTVVASSAYLGRYDAIGLALLLLLTLAGTRDHRADSRVATAVALAAIVAAATLSEEFLYFFFVPPVLAYAAASFEEVGQDSGDPRASTRTGMLVALPALLLGLGIAVASLLVRVPASTVGQAQKAAGPLAHGFDAAVFLGYTLGDELRYMRAFGIENVLAGTAMWIAVFAITCLLLQQLGAIRSHLGWFWLSVAYFAATAAALSYIAADWRRWWLVAFQAQLATTLLLQPRGRESASPLPQPTSATRWSSLPRLWRVLLAAMLVATVGFAYYSGVFPASSLVGKDYWKSDIAYWTPGHHALACEIGLSARRC